MIRLRVRRWCLQGGKRYPGGGGLCSQRVLTYLEPAALWSGCLEAYLGGGTGSKKPPALVAYQLGLTATDYTVENVLTHLKAVLDETETEDDGRSTNTLQRAVEATASRCPKLVELGLVRVCGQLAASPASGGVLETSLCECAMSPPPPPSHPSKPSLPLPSRVPPSCRCGAASHSLALPIPTLGCVSHAADSGAHGDASYCIRRSRALAAGVSVATRGGL